MSLVSGAAREASAHAAAAAFAAAEELITSQLNEGQLDFYRQTTSAVLEGEQALKLVCGEPGTGKTYACAAVEQRLRMSGVRCMAASFMWSAVFQMVVECPKTSLHGLLHSNPTSLTAATVVSGAALTGHVGQVRDHMEGYQVLLVDEISTTALFLFVALDMFLRAAFDESKPFGGKTVILLGDFCQLPPMVPPTTLAEALVSFSLEGVRKRFDASDEQRIATDAAKIFMDFQRMM
jgi:hypothetical protein